jgi:hypothetical protein
MYIFNLEMVTKVKIAKGDWENLRIRELAYTWTKQIRLFMIMRTLTFGFGSYLRNRDERNALAVFSCSFDLYMMYVIYSLCWVKPAKGSNGVVVHQSAVLPSLIQGSHIVVFLVACYFEYNDPNI